MVDITANQQMHRPQFGSSADSLHITDKLEFEKFLSNSQLQLQTCPLAPPQPNRQEELQCKIQCS